mmetsp:Transcript_38065/g.87760  ORF Transcript_38065/g.87760 Transcript_38065/m.87760 type:complete len:181 (+) Transcript_38065:148-690(+)
MADFRLQDLNALTDLLTQDQEDADSSTGYSAPSNPGSIVVRGNGIKDQSGGGGGAEEEGGAKKKKKDPKDIWDEDEVPTEEAILVEDMEDARPRPKYEILFKQDVMSEDVFLGMGEKTPGSSDCTHMTIRIQFPGHTMKVILSPCTPRVHRAFVRAIPHARMHAYHDARPRPRPPHARAS